MLDSILVFMHIVRMRTKIKTNPDAERTELGFKVALLIREVNSQLNANIAAELTAMGLTLPQITLIKALAHGKKLTITDLARELSTGKSTVVGIVDRLELAGLVRRTRESDDRREVYVSFSPDAKDRITKIKMMVDATFSKAFEGIPIKEFLGFENSLKKILIAIGG